MLLKSRQKDKRKWKNEKNKGKAKKFIIISLDRKGKVSSSEIEIRREIVWIKILKKDNFEKYLVALIKTNHQINMTYDHSVSSNNLFKSHWSSKSFGIFLIL